MTWDTELLFTYLSDTMVYLRDRFLAQRLDLIKGILGHVDLQVESFAFGGELVHLPTLD